MSPDVQSSIEIGGQRQSGADVTEVAFADAVPGGKKGAAGSNVEPLQPDEQTTDGVVRDLQRPEIDPETAAREAAIDREVVIAQAWEDAFTERVLESLRVNAYEAEWYEGARARAIQDATIIATFLGEGVLEWFQAKLAEEFATSDPKADHYSGDFTWLLDGYHARKRAHARAARQRERDRMQRKVDVHNEHMSDQHEW